MRTWFVIAVGLLTAGCASSTPGEGEAFMSPQEVRAKDEAKCASYGLARGTEPFSACLMKQDEIRAGVQTAIATSYRGSTTCNRYGNTTTCY